MSMHETMEPGVTLADSHTGDGNGPIGSAAARQQDNAGMPAVDGVAELAFHAQQFRLLAGPQRTYSNGVHGQVSM